MDASHCDETQLELIHELFTKCESKNMQFWLFGGWGIDALLGRVSRHHSDIDILSDAGSREDLRRILQEIGVEIFDNGTGWYCRKNEIGIDIGFLLTLSDGTIVSDVDPNDPCVYPWPTGSFPTVLNGTLPGLSCRAISWEAQYIAKAGYANAFPDTVLRAKDDADLRIISRHIPARRRKELRETVFGGVPRDILGIPYVR